MIKTEHWDYLLRRGYTPELLGVEPVFSVQEAFVLEGVNLSQAVGWVAWVCRSMAGTLIGIQTRSVPEKAYRWLQAPGAGYLPIIYGLPEDYEKLWVQGEAILVEGIFDRVAMKRCFPDMAVFARLSKGVSRQMEWFFRRYAKRLWLAFDMDEAGEKATKQAYGRMGEVELVRLQIAAKDPSKLLESRGLEKARAQLSVQMESMRC